MIKTPSFVGDSIVVCTHKNLFRIFSAPQALFPVSPVTGPPRCCVFSQCAPALHFVTGVHTRTHFQPWKCVPTPSSKSYLPPPWSKAFPSVTAAPRRLTRRKSAEGTAGVRGAVLFSAVEERASSYGFVRPPATNAGTLRVGLVRIVVSPEDTAVSVRWWPCL